MAFNPFHTFSVRSKVGKSVMAIVGIVVMLTFVLSSGAIGSGNDIFDQIGGLFSSKKGRGDVIAKAYGDDIRDSELNEVRRQRQAAREYLSRAVDVSFTELAKRLDSDVKAGRLSADTKDVVRQFVTLRMKNDTDRRAYTTYLIQFVNTQQLGPDIFKVADAWKKAQAKPDSDDKKAMDALMSILIGDVSRMAQQPPVYLVPLSTESDRDVLDFILLLKVADRLGIQFSTEGVKNLIARDAGGRLSDTDEREIIQALQRSGRFANMSGGWLMEAIANEYRAKIAFASLEGRPLAMEYFRAGRIQPFRILSILGVDLISTRAPGELSTMSAIPGGMTPAEFFEFYKDRCSESTFDVLEVRADAFLDQVKDQPTKAELTALFAKHRGDLPNPASDRPGFKEPRKVKVEFVALDANASRITQAIPKVQAASLFLCASGGAIAGSPMAALAEAAQPSMAETLPLREAVAAKLDANQAPYIEVHLFRPRDTSIFHPRPIVSALGILAGQPDVPTFVAAMAAVHQQVERIDHQTRVPFLLQSVLTPFTPTLGNALGMPARAYALNPKLPPESLYLGEATAALKKQQRQGLFQADVKQLQSKLRTLIVGDDPFGLAAKPDKAKLEKAREEAKKYLAEWLKDRGLTPAGNKAAGDQFTIVGDLELKPLNDVALPEPDGTNSLSMQLFEQSRNGYFVSPLQPFWFPADPIGDSLDKPTHLVWETEELPAKIAGNDFAQADKLTNGEMTKRVERAWRLEKARVLAKAEADRLAEQVRAIGKSSANNPGGIERQLHDLAAQQKLREFPLERMAPLKFDHGTQPGSEKYEPSTIDRKLVLYPTPDFTDRMFDLRKEPVGAVTVLTDMPRARFYVACLVAKSEKTVEQFRREVFDKANGTGIARDPLYTQYALREAQDQAMMEVRLRLRADAGLELKDAFKNRDKKEVE